MVVIVVVVIVIVAGHGGENTQKPGYVEAETLLGSGPMGTRAAYAALAAATAIWPWLAGEARAANNAYAVDAADISETGSCKIESWLSSATFCVVAIPISSSQPVMNSAISAPVSPSERA